MQWSSKKQLEQLFLVCRSRERGCILNAFTECWANARLWKRYLNGPLYLPEEGRHLVKVLRARGPNEFIAELLRHSSLGSPWASAALGYLALLPDSTGMRDAARAIELCRSHAEKDNAYAKFVLSWAFLHAGYPDRALIEMEKAARLGFAPANLDLVTLVWNGCGIGERQPMTALLLLRRATKDGHKAALVWRAVLYRSGSFGLTLRIWGALISPVSRLRYLTALLTSPFSSRVFYFQSRLTSKLFRQ